jgi:geranylgeranyl diphosphate synthase type II
MQELLNQFEELRKYIDDNLTRYLENKEGLLDGLYDSIRYSLFSGGKRIRPVFCFLVGELFDVPKEKLVSTACALEMIHTSSLIMDDLPYMDDAITRRGKTANHLVFGPDVAALASMALLMRSYEIILTDPLLPGAQKVKVAEKLAATIGPKGMVGGQYVDLKLLDKSANASVLEYIHAHKTASLFVLSGTMAAEIGAATAAELTAIGDFARNLGLAFQLADDILDADGSKQETGKSLKKDKCNFVQLYGLPRIKEMAQDYTNKAILATNIFGDRNKKLVALGRMLLDRHS